MNEGQLLMGLPGAGNDAYVEGKPSSRRMN